MPWGAVGNARPPLTCFLGRALRTMGARALEDAHSPPRGGDKMSTKRVVHVVGTGTLGEPLISLLLNLQRDLEFDELTFHKNRPLLDDRVKILTLMRRGAKLDRKSTRLNSSHSQISYAVFCLKKKKK